MCSSRYVPLLPLFFLFFGLSLFFWEILTFLFYFFDIFLLLRSTKEVTTKNMSLNRWKTWPVKNLENLLKIDTNLVTMKRGSCDHFLTNLKISNPDSVGDGQIQIFSDRFWYMERRNRSSYSKTRPVLRIGSELEDKTGTMCAKLVTTAKIWWKRWGKTHELDSNTT